MTCTIIIFAIILTTINITANITIIAIFLLLLLIRRDKYLAQMTWAKVRWLQLPLLLNDPDTTGGCEETNFSYRANLQIPSATSPLWMATKTKHAQNALLLISQSSYLLVE